MLKIKDGEIVTAANKLEIIDTIVNGHQALYVDQANPLNVTWDSKRQMIAPLVIDAVTASMLLSVRKRLSTESAIEKFESMKWVHLVDVCWKLVNQKTTKA